MSGHSLAEGIAQWLMPDDFEPRAGHRFRSRSKPAPGWSGIIDAEVLAIDPPRRMRKRIRELLEAK